MYGAIDKKFSNFLHEACKKNYVNDEHHQVEKTNVDDSCMSFRNHFVFQLLSEIRVQETFQSDSQSFETKSIPVLHLVA